jgi:hypothetical protein
MKSAIRLLLILGTACCAPASRADLIDDIEVRRDQGVAEFRLQFSMPVQYIKHFPQERGELLKIYLQAVVRDGLDPVDLQAYKRTPSVSDVPPFTVMYTTTRNCYAVRDPVCLDIQFSKPVAFRIRPGEDGRSLILIVLPEPNAGTTPKTKK